MGDCEACDALEATGAMVADGLGAALAGYALRFGVAEPVAVYDVGGILGIFEGQGATPAEAVEHFQFNVLGAWVGERTPIYLWRCRCGVDEGERASCAVCGA